MEIAVCGLGLIGGSLSGALKKCGHTVFGYDHDENVVEYAVKNGFIDGKAENITAFDVVILAVPPRTCLAMLEEGVFTENAIVFDVCGVKKTLEDVVYKKERNYRYVGTHPMAGKESNGVINATPELFKGANVILVRHEKTDEEAYLLVKTLWEEVGAGRIVETDSLEHDKMIAFTSQLAHIVSNGYVRSKTADRGVPFSGGSLQDMVRVAGADEKMWKDLFFLNSENVVAELDGLIERLKEYRTAIENHDGNALCELWSMGRKRWEILYKNRQ